MEDTNIICFTLIIKISIPFRSVLFIMQIVMFELKKILWIGKLEDIW